MDIWRLKYYLTYISFSVGYLFWRLAKELKDSRKSDIYSLSIITNEIIPPFSKEPHDYQISVVVNVQKK